MQEVHPAHRGVDYMQGFVWVPPVLQISTDISGSV